MPGRPQWISDEAALESSPERESELQRRLRGLQWPEPPAGARERGLESLLPYVAKLSENGNGDGHKRPAEPPEPLD